MRGEGGGRKQKGFRDPVRGKGNSIIVTQSNGYDHYLGMSHVAGTPFLPQNIVKIVLY